ncbi:hypothetical protein DL98DRAFT_535171 [Cadophora sp. DSE1049]|nr:hypothetical protein DL98DRAFT_535171 [Cadophora sp. DSE1049]
MLPIEPVIDRISRYYSSRGSSAVSVTIPLHDRQAIHPPYGGVVSVELTNQNALGQTTSDDSKPLATSIPASVDVTAGSSDIFETTATPIQNHPPSKAPLPLRTEGLEKGRLSVVRFRPPTTSPKPEEPSAKFPPSLPPTSDVDSMERRDSDREHDVARERATSEPSIAEANVPDASQAIQVIVPATELAIPKPKIYVAEPTR